MHENKGQNTLPLESPGEVKSLAKQEPAMHPALQAHPRLHTCRPSARCILEETQLCECFMLVSDGT